MRQNRRRPALLALTGLVASLLVLTTPGSAQADTTPPLKWPAVTANPNSVAISTSPAGEVTVGCSPWSTQNLVTYGATGSAVRQIPRIPQIDGVINCMPNPVVGKDGDVYGIPQSDTGTYGANLLAYDGNTLKWKYPLGCHNGPEGLPVVGPDGNIYATHRLSSGDVRLYGLKPDLEAGQTQPTKVLDLDVPDDCSIKVYPYKTGIMVHGQSTGLPKYYSYGGKYLGEATTGNISYEAVNAEGQLFNYHFVGSNPKTAALVSKFDPLKGEEVWRTQVSTPGATVSNVLHLRPTPDGGVVLLVKEQKMTGGLPDMPAVDVFTLVRLNADGVKTSSVQLPPKESSTGTYTDSINLLVDGNGNSILIRELNRSTGVSWPNTVPEIVVGMQDSSGNVTSEGGVFAGTINAQAQSGYALDLGSPKQIVSSQGALFLPISCEWDCTDYSTKLYAIDMDGFGIDYPRGELMDAEVPTGQPTAKEYVALGDSFSSGEGVEPFENGTDTATNKCHRSKKAYANLLSWSTEESPSLLKNNGRFAACSGAKTNEILNNHPTYSGEQAQKNRVKATTEIVTVTIGGNDIGFVDFGTACFYDTTTCRIGSNAHTTAVNKINNELPDKLKSTYRALLSQNGNNANIYVLGYPHVAPVKANGDLNDIRCPYLYNSGYDATGTIPLTWRDAQAARDVVDKLNTAINAAVTAVRAENSGNVRLHYVEVNGEDSPFEGHEACSSGESYFLNVNQAAVDQAYIFHPNAKGQKAYADLVADYINAS